MNDNHDDDGPRAHRFARKHDTMGVPPCKLQGPILVINHDADEFDSHLRELK